MAYMKETINSVMGVHYVVPSKRLHDIGEWKLLVDQTKCAFIHRHLSDTWQTILSNVPSHVLANAPANFALPTISSKRARDYQDADSDADSYGSLLTTGTEVSMMTNEDSTMNDLPEEYKYPSYASAAASSMQSGQGTHISSPTTSTNVDWQQEKQHLENLIKAQAEQIERIQADLQAKISRSTDLEEQLAQAIELAHSRDARHAEMLARFEQLMTTVMRVGDPNPPPPGPEDNNDPPSAPTTPVSTNPDGDNTTAVQSPPARPTNNASPHRALYTIFRQSGSRNNSLRTTPNIRQTKRKTPPTLLTQPMETDEEIRPPLPGAQPGTTRE